MRFRPWPHPEPRSGLCYPARLEPHRIVDLQNLVEGYDGLAVLRTKDSALGIVEFWVSPTMQQDFEDFLNTTKRDLELVAGPPQAIDMQQVLSELPKR